MIIHKRQHSIDQLGYETDQHAVWLATHGQTRLQWRVVDKSTGEIRDGMCSPAALALFLMGLPEE